MLQNLYYQRWCHKLQFFITRHCILPVPTQQNRDLSMSLSVGLTDTRKEPFKER